jgi:hypothetical protein
MTYCNETTSSTPHYSGDNTTLTKAYDVTTNESNKQTDMVIIIVFVYVLLITMMCCHHIFFGSHPSNRRIRIPCMCTQEDAFVKEALVTKVC